MGAWDVRHRQRGLRHLGPRRSESGRVIHVLSGLLLITQQLKKRQRRSDLAQSLQERRKRQRYGLMERLVEANPGLQRLGSPPQGWWLWRALRWGGPPLLLGWWLAQTATG